MSDDGDEGDEGDAAPSQADFDKLRKQLLETQQKLKKSSMLAKWGKTQVEQLRQQVEAKEEEKRQLQEQLNTQRKRKVGPPPATLFGNATKETENADTNKTKRRTSTTCNHA